jgi:ABC-type nitrate/sulfonate/bicarbonate transport system substrate-binding protein
MDRVPRTHRAGRGRGYAAGIVLLSCALLATACGGGGNASESKGQSTGQNGTPDLGTIRVVESVEQTFQYIPATLGQQLGVWKKRGLTVENVAVQGGSKSVQVLASGNADVELGSGPTDLLAIAKGLPSKIVGGIGLSFSPFIIVVPTNSPIKSAQDLKGKTVGITSAGSLTDVAVKKLEQKQGWSTDAVKEAAVGGLTEQLAALKSGSTQAFVWTAEAGYELQAKNEGRILLDFDSYIPNAVFQDINATTDVISKHPDALRAYLAGWYEAAQYMTTHEAETLKVVESLFDVSPDVAQAIYKGEIGGLVTSGAIPQSNLTGLAKLVGDANPGTKIPPTDSFYDGSLLPQ